MSEVKENISTNKIYVYYACAKYINIKKNIGFLPKNRQEKANILKSKKDKRLSIGVYLLLKKSLAIHNINIDDFEFSYNENGKPLLEGLPFEFSLSHSGNYVAVALSNAPVGIDIEKIRKVNQNVSKLVFNGDDEENFKNSQNNVDEFFKIWTSKEAVIKMMGGLKNKNLKDINLKKIKYIHSTKIKKYRLSVCTNESNNYLIETELRFSLDLYKASSASLINE